MRFSSYRTEGFYDEMFQEDGSPRPHARLLLESVESLPDGVLLRRKVAAERLLLQMGITFNVYADSAGAERIFPFDLLPRIVAAEEWAAHRTRPEAAHPRAQRLHRRHLSRAEDPEGRHHPRGGHSVGGLLPAAVPGPQSAAGASGAISPGSTWCGTADGQVYVLEDNLRVPSGVSYVLENREVLKRTFPQVFEGLSIRPVDRLPQPPAGDARVSGAPAPAIRARWC